ncbi:hypothetical protein LDK94_06675 [Staphylococcus arlettae]|uniref:hypothetical protein n=1 Tax=Staphylococcus arlettae TaxID=29378 RepID=UPI001E615FA2|nr:hypothetical protein [Staphylococcus arlettae]MCD9055019.1 hypothetical protein [Staphylococcus arlettae]
MINYEMALSEIEMYKKAHKSLSENLTHANKKAQQFKTERDTLIDDIAVLRANDKRLEQENERLKERNYQLLKINDRLYLDNYKLEHENARLTRLTHKLTTHRTMWDYLKGWRRDMLEIDKNDTQLIGLGLVMDELEHNWLYREEK